jgi:hypothetical protein
LLTQMLNVLIEDVGNLVKIGKSNVLCGRVHDGAFCK